MIKKMVKAIMLAILAIVVLLMVLFTYAYMGTDSLNEKAEIAGCIADYVGVTSVEIDDIVIKSAVDSIYIGVMSHTEDKIQLTCFKQNRFFKKRYDVLCAGGGSVGGPEVASLYTAIRGIEIYMLGGVDFTDGIYPAPSISDETRKLYKLKVENGQGFLFILDGK